jgi:hypothetical protein
VFGYIRLKGRILKFYHCISSVAQPDQSLHFLQSWPWKAERNDETGTSALRSIPSWDTNKRGTDPVFVVVVVVLDGTCFLQSFSLSTQAVSTDLSTEMSEGP